MSILLVALLALCQLASAEQLLAGAPWRTHSCVQRRDSSRRSVAVVQEMLDVQGDYRNSIQALHSAFQVADGERFPGSPHSRDAPVVFLISEETLVPPIALALSLAKQPIHAAVRKQLPAIGSQVSPHGIGPQDAGFEQRSAEIVKLLPGNIGYADLDRLRISMVKVHRQPDGRSRRRHYELHGSRWNSYHV